MRKFEPLERILPAANADLNRPFRIKHAGFHGQPKRRSMVEFRAVELAPRISVSVNVNHSNRSICSDAFENRKGDRVIATGGQRYDTGVVHLNIEILDVLDCLIEIEQVVDRHVTDVSDFRQFVRLNLRGHIDSTHQARRIAHLAGPVPCTRTVGNPEIHGHTDQRDVQAFERLGKRRAHECSNLGKARPTHGLGRRLPSGTGCIGHSPIVT